MPGKIIRKLNSKRGVTLLLALALFLTCAMVGSAVLAAAYSNAGRYARNVDKQQSYLAVMSATRLLEDELCSSTFSGSYQMVVTETQIPIYAPMTDEDGNTVLDENGEEVIDVVGYEVVTTTEYPPDKIESVLNSSILPETEPFRNLFLLYHSVPELAEFGNNSTDTKFYDVGIEPQSFEFPPVGGKLEVCCDDNGNVSHFDIMIKIRDAEDEANAVTMVFTAQIEPTFDVNTESGVDVNNYGYERTIYTYGINVTWAAPRIIKGASI